MSAVKSRSGGGAVHPVRNVVANWTAVVVTTVLGFVLSPYVVHRLGDTQYGVWVLLSTLVSYLVMLDLGVRSAVMRFVAHLHAGGDHDEAGRVASAGLALFGVLGLVAIAIGVGLAFAVEHVFKVPASLVGVARIVLVLGGVNIAAALVSGVFGGIITARQRFDVISSVAVALAVARALLIVLVLRLGYGLVALAVVQLGVSVVRGVADLFISHRLYPELRIRLRSGTRQHYRQLLGYSANAVPLYLSAMIILQMDSVIIGAFLPVAMITFFGIAATLIDSGYSLINGISHTVSPRVSALQGSGAGSSAGRVSLATGRLGTLVLLPIAITFILRGSVFIGLWMGESYAELSGRVLLVLSILLAATAGRQVIVTTLQGLNRHELLVPLFVVEAIVNLGLSIALVKPFGIVGLAWGTTIPGLVCTLFFMPRALYRVQDVRPREARWEIWMRPLLAMLPFALALYAISQAWEPASILGFFAEVALALPVAAVGAWVIGLDPDERLSLTRHLPPLLRLKPRGTPSSV